MWQSRHLLGVSGKAMEFVLGYTDFQQFEDMTYFSYMQRYVYDLQFHYNKPDFPFLMAVLHYQQLNGTKLQSITMHTFCLTVIFSKYYLEEQRL